MNSLDPGTKDKKALKLLAIRDEDLGVSPVKSKK